LGFDFVSQNPDKIAAMIGRENLAKIDAIYLALMCKKLSQDESQPEDIREKARKFMEEWINLQDNVLPKKGNGKHLDQTQEEIVDIKERMLDFLGPIV
jgi:hypothetical protein